MRYILFIILIMGGFLSLNVSASVFVDNVPYTSAQCLSRSPILNTYMTNWWRVPRPGGSDVFAYYDGCEYLAISTLSLTTASGYFSDWKPTGRVQPLSLPFTGGGGGSGTGSTGPVVVGGGGGSGNAPVTGGGGGSGSGPMIVPAPVIGGGDSSGSNQPVNINVNNPPPPAYQPGVVVNGSTAGGYGITTVTGDKPGTFVHNFDKPAPPFTYPGEPTQAEIRNYAIDFFIYNKECGKSCLDYFDLHRPFKPLSCEDALSNFSGEVWHKKPDCRSDEIAWYDGKGEFIDFKYVLKDSARHEIINKLKQVYYGSSATPSNSAPTFNISIPMENPFNIPGYTPGVFSTYQIYDENKYSGKTPFDLSASSNDYLEGIFRSTSHSSDLLAAGLDWSQQEFFELKKFHDDFNNYNHDIIEVLNKNHEDTMKALDVSGGSLDGVKGGLSSGVSSLVDGLKKEMSDSFNDALAEFKDVFGDIDSYIPDIELSFDLPVQFTAGIRGRCVPLVFDFNIALAGFSPYHFHAEGVQACKLYDLYIRSIIEWFLYFMTAFACRRVFTRAAEFITSR